ncbi:MAG: hypothetical protein HZA28_05920 [Candidatus Omnitrophica bacterium]|nr:hypothetical protein [Candidatus Omnitrophota bacterium]
MKINIPISVCFSFFLLGTGAGADTIYLQNKPTGNQGEVLEEYPDAIIIRFPKSEIKRIEAEEKPHVSESGNMQKVIWIEDGDTITLRLPKQSVQVSGSEALENLGQSQPAPQTVSSTTSQPVISSIQKMLAQDRVIQGKVFMRGSALAHCKIRILKVTDFTQDRMLRLLTGSSEKEEEQSFEAVSDEYGIYTFTNIPFGEYILYWKPEGSENWIRRLSENPDITLVPGRPVAVRDIETNVKTVN